MLYQILCSKGQEEKENGENKTFNTILSIQPF